MPERKVQYPKKREDTKDRSKVVKQQRDFVPREQRTNRDLTQGRMK